MQSELGNDCVAYFVNCISNTRTKDGWVLIFLGENAYFVYICDIYKFIWYLSARIKHMKNQMPLESEHQFINCIVSSIRNHPFPRLSANKLYKHVAVVIQYDSPLFLIECKSERWKMATVWVGVNIHHIHLFARIVCT